MLKKQRCLPILCFVLYAACLLLAARLLLTCAGAIFGWVGALIDLPAATVSYGKDILRQLQDAAIVLPWPVFLPVFALLGWGYTCLRRKRIWLAVVLGLLLFVPLTVAAVLLTEVNGILTGRLVCYFLRFL